MYTQNGMPVTTLPVEDVISNLETCCLCGSRLRFKHMTDFLNLTVQEEAACPDCGVKNKTASFILQ